MNKERVLIRLRKAASGLTKNTLELGRASIDLYAMGMSVEEISQEARTSARTIYTAIGVVNYVDKHNLADFTVLDVGVWKLTLLAQHVVDEDPEPWLEKAAKMTYHRLREELEGRPHRGRVYNFYLDDEEHSLVSRILVRFGANRRGRGLADKDAALVAALRRLEELENA